MPRIQLIQFIQFIQFIHLFLSTFVNQHRLPFAFSGRFRFGAWPWPPWISAFRQRSFRWFVIVTITRRCDRISRCSLLGRPSWWRQLYQRFVCGAGRAGFHHSKLSFLGFWLMFAQMQTHNIGPPLSLTRKRLMHNFDGHTIHANFKNQRFCLCQHFYDTFHCGSDFTVAWIIV